ncbi:hypothetical protein D9613_003824 [Agrocybe pediades]|uniref:U3 small nucleolar RNA-associated protein 10 n=1 Tax=Agrocybe pediades TaxID=84607 RepID=A0A8H4QIP7_9AGAR|nr:hypothetical protein D9613_003824 [Agrocybe pediades]
MHALLCGTILCTIIFSHHLYHIIYAQDMITRFESADKVVQIFYKYTSDVAIEPSTVMVGFWGKSRTQTQTGTTQLAQNVSLNASLLVDRSRRKPTQSYLFTGREADQYDLESIHALGVNSLLHLASLNPALEKYEDTLFSDRAKETDRTLLTAEAVEELDKAIENLLWLLSPYLMESPTGKIIEWLVRRFRINEFNVEAILSLFLPYHESPHFAKMITILNIKPNSTWSFLIPYKSAAQNVPRVSLVTEMLKNSEVARFVASLLPTAIKKGVCHRVIVTFNAATFHDFIKRSKSFNEGTVAYLLPAFLEPLQQKPKKLLKDAVLGSYILLASLGKKCELSPAALKVILSAVASCAHVVSANQFVNSLVAICESQPELEEFSGATLKAILRVSGIKDELVNASAWTGSEKVLNPLMRGLSAQLEGNAVFEFLEATVAAQSTPAPVIETLATSLLKTAVGTDADSNVTLSARRLLAQVRQRQPDLLEKALESYAEEEESLKDALEQLSISLSTIGQVSSSSEQGTGVMLASADADSRVRVAAVKDLIASLVGKDLKDISDLDSIRGILSTRLQDTSITVLEALYSNPFVITPIFASDPSLYISNLSLAIDSQAKTKRNVLRLHFSYLTQSFWAAVDSSVQEQVFHQIIFPFLLFSKPRQKTAELVWDSIDEHIEWIQGCAALVKQAPAEGTDPVDHMNQVNYEVADKIADNIVKSSKSSEHIKLVIEKLGDSRPHVKLMGYLIAPKIVRKLSGAPQVDVALQFMEAMGLTDLPAIDDLSQEHLALASADDRSLGKYIITKPSSRTSCNWLQISLLAQICRIPRPADLLLDWLASIASGTTDVGQRYVNLIRSIYRLANASASVPVLATTLLQILFASLKGDSLAFLAGLWSNGDAGDSPDSISLLHAAAFLEAHIQENDGVDFQTIIPALLVALQSTDARTCQGAIECLARIRLLSERKLSSVYRFDTIYGENENALQYLDQEDLKRYLSALVEHRDHFANDASYLKVLHEQHLNRSKTDKKRDADYKNRVVCYLLSHINATSSEIIQISLLKSIATITNKAKVQILAPTIELLVARAESEDVPVSNAPSSEELTTRVLSCYDTASAQYVNESTSAWDLFVRVVRAYFRSGAALSSQEALAHGFETGLFNSLNQQRKQAICDVLLDVGSQENGGSSLARRVLTNILTDVTLIVTLLESLTPAPATSSPRVSKRAKTTDAPEDTLPRLSLLVEVLGTKSLPGSLDLVARLLDTLSNIVQVLPQDQADVSYTEQLLMSAVESSASKITEVPNISPSVIRLDILVEVIRVQDTYTHPVSNNPQTFHQALLLIANLARLAPESVLYNVMPVFTFMGSNVFHRDDSYSFKVVQQTIDGIVPVMVSSLKEAHSNSLDLYLASKEFLRVFSDAANHIPRHRRNNFFAHLINVLGPRDFLAPICMLLLEKTANRVIRQPADEVQNSLSLPIFLFQHNDHVLQLHAATEILEESKRIVAHIANPESTQPIFLEGTADGDHSASSSTILRRRAQALIVLVGYALKPRSAAVGGGDANVSISSVIAQLITLATLPEGTTTETRLQDVSEAARSTMNRLLTGMSVVDFIEAVQAMLESGDLKVQSGALDLLARRLPDVSAKMRPALTASVNKILISIKNITSVHKGIADYALQAIKSVSATIAPGEEGGLTDLVPFVLAATKEKDTAPSAMGALSSMSVKLGPRIIPFFRSIISQNLFEDAFAILHGLLQTIPTFWGSSEVTQVAYLYMDQASSASKPFAAALSSLTKSLAKRTPAKVLVPTLVEMWQSAQFSGNLNKTSAYFDVLARVLQHSDRPTVLEYLRASFKIFLEALDIVKVDLEAETHVIAAFKELVVKLNETAFKPLFRRLYDWAFVEKSVANDHVKGLMVPYMTFLLQPFTDILTSFAKSSADNFALWSSVVQVLARTLNFDDAGYWRDDKLRQIATPLTNQIEVCVRLKFTDSAGKAQLQDCFNALIENATDDTLLKNINLGILMHTRSEDARVRLFALSCSEAIWKTSGGGKLLGFVAETATFISECSEDENDLVVKECFKLKDAVESVAGKIDGL